MKVLLISANTLKTPYPVYPLGLDHVADALWTDHEVRIADMNELDHVDPLVRMIDSFNPDVVGMSLRNIDNTDQTKQQSFVAGYRRLVDVIRKVTNATLVLGGSGFTLFPDEMMETLGADYGIIGEGERLADLLSAMDKEAPTIGIPGVVTAKEPKPIPPPLMGPHGRKNLLENPHLQYYLKNGGMLNLQTKRGCPFRCIYCTYPHIEGRKLRLISPDAAAEDALRLQKVGAKYFFITDSVFNSDTEHSMAVAEAFMAAGLKIPWGAFFAPMDSPKGYFELMARAGLTHAEFGTESMCNAVLKNYGKPFRTQHVLGAHNAAIDSGLYVSHFFLLGGPGENGDSIDETLNNIEKLTRSVFFFFALCVSIRIRIFTIWRWRKGRYRPSPLFLSPAFTRLQWSPKTTSLSALRHMRKSAPTGWSVPGEIPQPGL